MATAATVDETLVPLRQAPERLGTPTWDTLKRWASEGLCGGRAKLRLARVGGRLFVSRERLAEFQAAVDRLKDAPRPAPPEGPRARRRRSREARAYADSFDARPPG